MSYGKLKEDFINYDVTAFTLDGEICAFKYMGKLFAYTQGAADIFDKVQVPYSRHSDQNLQNSKPYKLYMNHKNQKMDYSKIDNIVFEGINTKDAPSFADTFIQSADYDGVPMTDTQLDEINDDGDYVYEQLLDYIY